VHYNKPQVESLPPNNQLPARQQSSHRLPVRFSKHFARNARRKGRAVRADGRQPTPKMVRKRTGVYLLALATRSISSFFLIA